MKKTHSYYMIFVCQFLTLMVYPTSVTVRQTRLNTDFAAELCLHDHINLTE